MQYELNYKKTTLSKSIIGKPPPLGKIDYIKKTTALDFHPFRNTVAVASLNCFFLYSMWFLILSLINFFIMNVPNFYNFEINGAIFTLETI